MITSSRTTLAKFSAVAISVLFMGSVAMAHIHIGARDNAGPQAIPLSNSADHVWSVPSGAKLASAQYISYKAGDL